MAFNDTLFQLGMDLTRSSTAQKEDFDGSARVAQEDCYGTLANCDGMPGTSKHLIIDLTGAKRCDTAKSAEKSLREALEGAKGKLINVSIRRTQKGRCLAGSASLADGEVKIEAWPETGYVAVDVFGAASMRPELVMSMLMDAFGAREAMIKKSRTSAEVARLTKPVRWVAPAAVRTPVRATERPLRARRAA